MNEKEIEAKDKEIEKLEARSQRAGGAGIAHGGVRSPRMTTTEESHASRMKHEHGCIGPSDGSSPPPSARPRSWPSGCKTSPLIAQILLNRGIAEAEECSGLPPPEPQVPARSRERSRTSRKAAERIAQAIRDSEKIVIYGDYDVDGITATAILWHAIRCSAARSTTTSPTASTKATA